MLKVLWQHRERFERKENIIIIQRNLKNQTAYGERLKNAITDFDYK